MPSIPETLMVETLARVRAGLTTSALVQDVEQQVRREHRTAMMRGTDPAVHLLFGRLDEEPGTKTGAGCRRWRFPFTARVYVRADDGFATSDPIMLAVLAALDPGAVPYPNRATLAFRRVAWDQEVADEDANATDIDCEFAFEAPGYWRLTA